MSAGDVTARSVLELRESMIETTMDDRWCARSVCEDAIEALEASRAEVASLRRQVEERSGRSSIQDPADSDLDSILYDVGGDTGNEFQRRLIRYGIEWARDHFAPSESASLEQCDRIAQMLADNPLNRMCDADSDPSPDVVPVPREEWISVEDRLPEDGQNVGFITDSKGNEYYHRRVYGGRFHRSDWDMGFGGFNTHGLGSGASHWFPFPTIPDALRSGEAPAQRGDG